MVTVGTIAEAIEQFAPLSLQMEHDNCGLLVGCREQAASRVLLTLDLTEAVVCEAVASHAQMIVCHHPPVFQALKQFDQTEPTHRAVLAAIKADIAVYAAHTNVDFTEGGLNDYVAAMLDLKEVGLTSGDPSDPRIGTLKTPRTLKEYAKFVKEVLADNNVMTIGDPNKKICRAAVINGGGGSDQEAIKNAFLSGADVFLTSEIKYHIARFTKDNNYAMIYFGHYNSEVCFSELMEGVLSKVLGCTILKSKCCSNPYNG